MAAAQRCRLLELPAELRVQIYEYAFGDYEISLRTDWECCIVKPAPPPLLMVNKQIYDEAVDIFYRCVTVTYALPNKLELREFSRLIPRSRWLDIKHVTIVCPVTCWHEGGDKDEDEFHRAVRSCAMHDLGLIGATEAVARFQQSNIPYACCEAGGED